MGKKPEGGPLLTFIPCSYFFYAKSVSVRITLVRCTFLVYYEKMNFLFFVFVTVFVVVGQSFVTIRTTVVCTHDFVFVTESVVIVVRQSFVTIFTIAITLD